MIIIVVYPPGPPLSPADSGLCFVMQMSCLSNNIASEKKKLINARKIGVVAAAYHLHNIIILDIRFTHAY